MSDAQRAVERYEKWKKDDPFASIRPGLLSIDDIKKYVECAGLIDPFNASAAGAAKPASYGLSLEGHCTWWDDEGRKHDLFLSKDTSRRTVDGLEVCSQVTLRKNSIIFVTLGGAIRLPYYIAARFNLRIKWIYAGLIVGTGTLVDPGFAHPLTCPIHNLTDDDYILRTDEVFAWIEFTKLGIWDYEAYPALVEEGVLRYSGRTLDVLLNEANRGNAVRSSIPTAFHSSQLSAAAAQSAAEAAKAEAVRASNSSRNLSIATIVAVIALLATFLAGLAELSTQNHALSVTGTSTYAADKAAENQAILRINQRLSRDEAERNQARPSGSK